ncbi:MAG: hypothetical protein R2778_16535 [Saprospiraceae bacterium]
MTVYRIGSTLDLKSGNNWELLRWNVRKNWAPGAFSSCRIQKHIQAINLYFKLGFRCVPLDSDDLSEPIFRWKSGFDMLIENN